jgi:hypothetical protein
LPTCRASGDTHWRAKTRISHGVVEVNSVSYLPAAFTTLFFLAASLLLGLIR